MNAAAELLRRAAAKLRETATAATPGPWTVEVHEGGYGDDMLYAVIGPEDDEGVTPIPLQTRTEDAGFHSQAQADVDFAALMHPPVALALAAWLDRDAETIDIARSGYAVLSDDPDAVVAEFHRHSIAVARAILREEP